MTGLTLPLRCVVFHRPADLTAKTEKNLFLFLDLLRILAEEDLREFDEEEILELLESGDWEEIEDFIERKAFKFNKVLH